MSVRAKFRVNSIADHGYGREVSLTAVYEGALGENEENKRFTKATPNGSIKMMIDNPWAWKQYDVGQEWYVDFSLATPAPERTE